jgi:hypothetical protein
MSFVAPGGGKRPVQGLARSASTMRAIIADPAILKELEP